MRLLSELFNQANRWVDSLALPVQPHPTKAEIVPKSAKADDTGFHNDITISALIDFDRLCAEIEQEYFLVSGTFLGAVRDGGFIGHDHDIDLGVFEDRLTIELLPRLKESYKFRVTRVDHAYLRHMNEGGEIIDE